jgi:hypothetical protein
MILYGRSDNGPFTFNNSAEIQAAGGASGGAGQHAIYIYNSVAGALRPIIINNGAIRGGGGGGGKGGTGGAGGKGGVTTWTYEGYPGVLVAGDKIWTKFGPATGNGSQTVFWDKVSIFGTGGVASGATTATSGQWTYFKGDFSFTNFGNNYYEVYRGYTITTTYNGGAGGAGGAGGQGQGYNDAETAGAAGAAGANPAAPSTGGTGGTGGKGGTGGDWGAKGGTGATGGTGGTGTGTGATAGSAGTAGVAGGAAGYSIYAVTPWGYSNPGINNGPYGGGVANS